MRRWARAVLGTVGLATIVYGAASLTGAWLGEPPWWTVQAGAPRLVLEDTDEVMPTFAHGEWVVPMRGRDGRELISGAVVLAGLALLAFTVWPRRGNTMQGAAKPT